MACDGVDALGALQQQAADIVLTDVNMPNMDGYQLTERLRQQGRTLPIVGVTANALAEERQRCIEVGMDSCLSKPVMREDLLASLSGYAQQIRQPGERGIKKLTDGGGACDYALSSCGMILTDDR